MANSVRIFERKNKSKNFNSLENFHIFGNLPKKLILLQKKYGTLPKMFYSC